MSPVTIAVNFKILNLAEEEGFEPPETLPGSVVFKTTAIDHSAIPPQRNPGPNSHVRETDHLASVTASVTNVTMQELASGRL